MQVESPGQERGAGCAQPVEIQRFLRRLDHLGMGGKPQVVVGGHINDLVALPIEAAQDLGARPGGGKKLLPEEAHCRPDFRVLEPRLEIARRCEDVRAVVEEEIRQAETERLVSHCPCSHIQETCRPAGLCC